MRNETDRRLLALAAALLASGAAVYAGRAADGSGTHAEAPSSSSIHLTIPKRTVHNSSYLEASFLYQLQVLLWQAPRRLDVTDGALVRRVGKELYLDLARLSSEKAALVRRIAGASAPGDELGLDEISSYMREHYYEITRPPATLDALLRARPYRDNPDWLTVPVDSATFRRRRVLRIEKDRIADALAAYFASSNRLLYPEGTTIVAESLDKQGAFVEAEVLTKRPDSFWDFSAYDSRGRLIGETVSFDEDGEPDHREGFRVPQACATCHRADRVDASGDPDSPVLAPIRGYFHRLPLRVPQIHLGPEYYDHMAFTELTEATGRVKDGVFGVYGSLLLSELAGRKRLGTLTEPDKARYRRLQPLYPELLTSLDRVDSVVNSIGMRLLRIPASRPDALIGSPASDPEHRPDEPRRTAGISRPFFMADLEVTNAQFRMFDPRHRSGPYRGVVLDGDDQPVVDVGYEEAQAFVRWLGERPAERQARRTYRLPTEEEWEYAAKGGDDRRFPWGDQWPPPEGSGNFGDETTGTVFKEAWPILHGYRDGHVGTAPVGRFFPNAYFLYDMAGNAYEWTSSVEPGRSVPAAEAGGGPRRVVRGSSWADELPKVLRCAFRLPVAPDAKTPFLSFRVVAEIPSLE